MALGDLDGDGDLLDAFVANKNSPDKVRLNDGAGSFSGSGQSLGDAGSRDVSLGDLDGDGNLNALVVYSFAGGAVPDKVWLNDGLGNYSDSGHNVGQR